MMPISEVGLGMPQLGMVRHTSGVEQNRELLLGRDCEDSQPRTKKEVFSEKQVSMGKVTRTRSPGNYLIQR